MNTLCRLGLQRIQPCVKPLIGYARKQGMKKFRVPMLKEIKKLQTDEKKQGKRKSFHRNTMLEWNYDSELYAFGKRLHEEFDDDLLRKALTERSYISRLAEEQKKVGIEASIDEKFDNREMVIDGEQITNDFVTLFLRHTLPRVPEEGIQAIKDHLTSEEQLSHICSHLGTGELILCADFPVEKSTLVSVFKALVSALKDSSGLERASLFIRDFVITQLAQQDINDFWNIENPIEALDVICKNEGLSKPEPRLVGEAGRNTILALFRVGIYVEKQLIGLGPGESVQIAHEIAACDALRRLFGTSEHQLLLPFDLVLDPTAESVPNVSLKEWCEAKVQERLKLVAQPKQAMQAQ